jgi:DNA polymerase III sliding clamp (beta) subunit (PCNA family)
MPKVAGKSIVLPRAQIASILAQLDVLTYMGVPTVQLVLENNLAVWIAEGSDGRFHQEEVINFEGDKIVMFYNPNTLAGAIKTRKAENMTFEVTGSLAPTFLRELDLPFESICVFAPLRPGYA